jgi:hypothetical protein
VPDSSPPRLAHIGLKSCQVSLEWRHGLALAGNAASSRCLRTCSYLLTKHQGYISQFSPVDLLLSRDRTFLYKNSRVEIPRSHIHVQNFLSGNTEMGVTGG